LELTTQLYLFDFKPISKWTDGRVALIGDAAHATTPNLGQGAYQRFGSEAGDEYISTFIYYSASTLKLTSNLIYSLRHSAKASRVANIYMYETNTCY